MSLEEQNATRIDEILVAVQQIKDKLESDARQQNLPALVNQAFQIDELGIKTPTNYGECFGFRSMCTYLAYLQEV